MATNDLKNNAPVVPGQQLGKAIEYKAGLGTYEENGMIYASLLGTLNIMKNEISVVCRRGKRNGSLQLLHLGDIVLCKVTRLATRQAILDIISIDNIPLKESFPGTLRLEDVRKHDIDKIDLEQMYPPGTLVRASILSFGDTRSYFLSTARPGLGAVTIAPQNTTEQVDKDINMEIEQ